jgi:hypothetical protein
VRRPWTPNTAPRSLAGPANGADPVFGGPLAPLRPRWSRPGAEAAIAHATVDTTACEGAPAALRVIVDPAGAVVAGREEGGRDW